MEIRRDYCKKYRNKDRLENIINQRRKNMCDKRKGINIPKNNETELRHDGMGYSPNKSFERIYENVGTNTTKPFDLSLMTGSNTNNNGKKK